MTSGRQEAGGSSEGGAPGDPEPRAEGPAPPKPFGLRIALYILAIYVCQVAGTTLVIYLLEGPEKVQELWNRPPAGEPVAHSLLLGLKAQLFLAPIILAVTGLFAAADGRTFGNLGIAWPRRRWLGPLSQLLAAVAAAAALLTGWWLLAQNFATFTTADAFPAEQVAGMGSWLPLQATGLLLFAGAFFVLGFAEEVIFRGYVFAVLRDRLPWIHAAGLSGILFALFRPGDPTVLAPSLLNVFLLGLLLAALREASGSVLVGSLFHGAWNVVLGCVLSLPVSGLLLPRREHLEFEGPLWATGGDFGPEGSWLLTGFLVAAVLAATAWVEAGAGTAGEVGETSDEDAAAS